MTQSIETREGLPHEMQALLRAYPRDTWPEHPNFAAPIRKWMGAHQMFRDLSGLTLDDTEAFLDKRMAPGDYAGRLAHSGNLLVRNLHGHHTWEDRRFFPELGGADPRFAEGLAMLEGDHLALDGLLDRFTRQSNRLIQLEQLDPDRLDSEAGIVHDLAGRLGGFLARHLSDEEDLAVPILLHHALRG